MTTKPICEPTPPATWRETIAMAAAAVPAAYIHRQQVMRAAHDAGYSQRQIAEAAHLSVATVCRIISATDHQRLSLDAPVGGSR